jgi:hypothetical protein
VHDRLDRDAMDNKKEAVKRELEKIAHEMEGLTFKPHLPVSTYIFLRLYLRVYKKPEFFLIERKILFFFLFS